MTNPVATVLSPVVHSGSGYNYYVYFKLTVTILAHAGGVLYGTELGSVTLKRVGLFCFPIKHSTHTHTPFSPGLLTDLLKGLLGSPYSQHGILWQARGGPQYLEIFRAGAIENRPTGQRWILEAGLRVGGPGKPPFWRTLKEFCTVRNSAR